MKDGVYINTFRGNANLVVFDNGEIEDGDVVTFQNYNATFSLTENVLTITYSDLKYIGEL